MKIISNVEVMKNLQATAEHVATDPYRVQSGRTTMDEQDVLIAAAGSMGGRPEEISQADIQGFMAVASGKFDDEGWQDGGALSSSMVSLNDMNVIQGEVRQAAREKAPQSKGFNQTG